MHTVLTSIILHSIKYNEKCLIFMSKVISLSEITFMIAQNPSIILQSKRTAWNQAALRHLQLKLLCTSHSLSEEQNHQTKPIPYKTQRNMIIYCQISRRKPAKFKLQPEQGRVSKNQKVGSKISGTKSQQEALEGNYNKECKRLNKQPLIQIC